MSTTPSTRGTTAVELATPAGVEPHRPTRRPASPSVPQGAGERSARSGPQPPGDVARPSIPSFTVKAKSGDRTGVGWVFSADRGP